MSDFSTIFLDKLLCENTGALSRMKERDRNDTLQKILDEFFKNQLTNDLKRAIITSENESEGEIKP